jgi:hypothetical protein
MKKLIKSLATLLTMVIVANAITPFSAVNTKAATTITPISVKSYSELDTAVENGDSRAVTLTTDVKTQTIDFTMNEAGYVRVAFVVTKEKFSNTGISASIKSRSLLTDYTSDDIDVSECYEGIYSGGAVAKLDAGNYSIVLTDVYTSGCNVKVYLGVLPNNTDFLSASFVGVSKDASVGEGTILQINSTDKIKVLKADTSNYGSVGSFSTSVIGTTYTLNEKNQIIVPISSGSPYISIWTKDVVGYEHYVWYGVINSKIATVEGIKDKYYTGKAIKQSGITVKVGYKTPTYKVSYKNNVKTGKATMTITGTGNWIGSVTKTFNIVKDTKKPTVKGVKNNKTYKKAVTIKFADASGIKKATLNGKKIKSGKKVKKNGHYVLKVTDRAGNTRKVRFKVKIKEK